MLSIVVPTYDRAAEIGRCLESIRSQSKDQNEILILSPNPGHYLRELCTSFSARLIDDQSRKNGRRSKSLWKIINDGIACASSEFVCWLNDDCVVNRDWDGIALSYFSPTVGLVVLRTKGINGNQEYEVGAGYYGIPCANYGVLRKSAGIRFDERYNWFYGDADISLQMAMHTGFKVVGTRENLVVHAHRIDDVRRDNEADPRTAEDRAYFEMKWSYKKRAGERLIEMNGIEKVSAKCIELLRWIYHKLKEIGGH